VRGNGLRLSVTLLTILPWPVRYAATEPTPAEAGEAMAWAPGVGALLGGLAAFILWISNGPLGLGPLLGAVLAVGSLAALTRGLHLDGLADLADGLGSGKPADAALEIMRKSDIGPMGVVTLAFTVLLQVAALARASSVSSWRGVAALVVAVVTGRLAVTWACRPSVPAARPSGLGALVAGRVPVAVAAAITGVVAVLTILAAVLWSPALPWTLPVAVVCGLAGAYVLSRHAVRRLGGITGDVLGALAEVGATVALLVAAITR
jgi:adenosylcobinamide-GDP ribazoletransferase